MEFSLFFSQNARITTTTTYLFYNFIHVYYSNHYPLTQGVIPEKNFCEVAKLPSNTANAILNAWLADSQRQLTTQQNQLVMRAFEESPLPLFLKLSFDQATKWKSYQDISTVTLEKNVKDSINKLFSDLERMHGKYLVAHALGLITCSKHGLSDAEIDDILSIDDEVHAELFCI